MTEAELKMFDEALEKKGPSAGKVLGATVSTAAAIPAAAYGGEKACDLGIKMRDSKTIQNAVSNILGKIKL